jgi:hypothetical protein
MTATVTAGGWTPLPGSLPISVEADTIYVVPTRATVGDEGGVPRYSDTVRYLPKDARAAGASIEFSVPEGSRVFLQEFSAVEVWSIALAAASLANTWLVLAVQLLIERRQSSEGWTSEQANSLPLNVSVAKLDDGAAVLETFRIEGRSDDVLGALRALNNVQSKPKPPELER